MPRINKKEINKTQLLIDKWKSVHPDIKEAVNGENQAYMWIWTEVDEILEMYHIPLN